MITPEALAKLDSQVTAALDGTTPATLEVLGYGEISTVLRAEGIDGPVACKRLPMMPPAALGSYTRTLDAYLAALTGKGVVVAPSQIHTLGTNPLTPYCVQPLYERLLTDVLREDDQAERFAPQLVDTVANAVTSRLGLDGQVSNWAVIDSHLVYLDVTTPMIRDSEGQEMLDTEMFLASLPWVLRPPVRRFLLREILSHYYTPRTVMLDLVANLYKEGLDNRIEVFVQAARSRCDPPISAEEARRYYRNDALMWEMLQRLRRADRRFQHLRGRRYPFLLPGKVERHV